MKNRILFLILVVAVLATAGMLLNKPEDLPERKQAMNASFSYTLTAEHASPTFEPSSSKPTEGPPPSGTYQTTGKATWATIYEKYPALEMIHHKAALRDIDRRMSDSELQILGLVGCGLTDAEIAQQLGVTVRTAQTHRSHILCKLGIRGTPKLMRFAVQHGLTHFL